MAADKGKGGAVNYDDMKAKLKEFLSGYHKVNDRGQKEFVYARQITDISHREQVIVLKAFRGPQFLVHLLSRSDLNGPT